MRKSIGSTMRITLAMLPLLLGTSLVAHAADIDTTKRIKVAMVPKLVGLSVFKANQQGAEDAAKKLNIDFLYTGPVTASAQGQVDVFNSLIARRFTAITTTSNNPTQLAPALRRARAQGIKVVSYDSDVAADARDFFIQNTDYAAFGKALVESVAKYAGPEAKVAILSSTPDATIQNEWIKALTAYMTATYPKMRIVTTQVRAIEPLAIPDRRAQHPAGQCGCHRHHRARWRGRGWRRRGGRETRTHRQGFRHRLQRPQRDPSVCEVRHHQGEPALG